MYVRMYVSAYVYNNIKRTSFYAKQIAIQFQLTKKQETPKVFSEIFYKFGQSIYFSSSTRGHTNWYLGTIDLCTFLQSTIEKNSVE